MANSAENFAALLDFVKTKLDAGRSKEQIIKDLVKKKANEPDANKAVTLAVDYLANNPLESKTLLRAYKAGKGKGRLLEGGIYLLIGLGITGFTYYSARSGGTYVLAWGAILVGALRILEGFFLWVDSRAGTVRLPYSQVPQDQAQQEQIPRDQDRAINKPQPNKNTKPPNLFGRVLFFGLILLGIYSGYRYFIDLNAYKRGHADYEALNCRQAINEFDTIESSWRVYDFDGIVSSSNNEKGQCASWLTAEDMAVSGPGDVAVLAFLDIFQNSEIDVWVSEARDRIGDVFSNHSLHDLATMSFCYKLDYLDEQGLILNSPQNLPQLYLECGNIFQDQGPDKEAYQYYRYFFDLFPNHRLTGDVEESFASALIANGYCDHVADFADEPIPDNVMPLVYFGCGNSFVDRRQYSSAIEYYDGFLALFPNHRLANDVEEALASALLQEARNSGAGELVAPEASGITQAGSAVVIVRNDTPNELRIVFSGLQNIIERLGPCADCITYPDPGPLSCPEKGPVGTYTLLPGDYDVLVEVVNESGITPWVGNWALSDGYEYANCFYIVTSTFP